MITNPDQQGADDQNALHEWEDGEGAEVATTSGIWHAALAWERARVGVTWHKGPFPKLPTMEDAMTCFVTVEVPDPFKPEDTCREVWEAFFAFDETEMRHAWHVDGQQRDDLNVIAYMPKIKPFRG